MNPATESAGYNLGSDPYFHGADVGPDKSEVPSTTTPNGDVGNSGSGV